MEVLSSKVQMRTSDQMPSSFDSLLACSGVRVSTSDITPFPPQKLRPIRCKYNNTQAFESQGSGEFGVMSGRSSLEEVGLGELGFVSNLRDKLLTAVVEEVDMDMRIGNVEIEEQNLQAYSSSESEDSGDLLENAQSSDNRKRRRTRERLEGFMEKLVSEVLLKQEMMHNKLMEMIETKERERLKREEAWKQREMERMRRDEQFRAQETARNVALITFIKNIMGKDFGMAKPLQMNNLLKDEAEVYQQRDMVNDDDKFLTPKKR